MRRFKKTIGMLAASLLVTGLIAAPAVAGADEPALPIYLALGDSWAAGEGATDPATEGYVPQLFAALQRDLDCLPATSDNAADGCKHLSLINLGRSGDAEHPGVTAPIVAAEQLPTALALLGERNQDANPRNNVEVITLHVGGNDVTGPAIAACIEGFNEGCIVTLITEMATLQADLRNVVGQLREAAGPDTIIVLGTYASPVPYCYLGGIPGADQLGAVVGQLREAAGPDTIIVLGTYASPVPYCYLGGIPGADQLGAVVLEGTPDGSLDGIHDVVRRVAAEYDAEVAEVFGHLGDGDFVGGSDCLHPTSAGYDHVTGAFRAAIGS
ncbi:MAG: SGNH/GDSL hydrolase family protein [Acidimicrobiia bacterium]|nr:SGNH/GDSL hydrolase family protein [Acidimicrobiia bacterium]